MSRRAPSTGASRVGSRAPSLAPSSRLSRPASSASSLAGRRTTNAGVPNIRVPSDIPETNINVVVRCRGRTPQEIAENSPPITQTGGPISDAITVTTTPVAASSSLVVPTAAENTKTYKFDKVFGPEADQTTVFTEVAENMLNEVLAGYNCTIFAYGQTGTGKTYTMQGDMTPTPLGAPSFEAGIIPRVLHRLFALLDAQENSEYAVKCSYIEIYNEELRDLLSYDYAAPGASSNIKIFEDSAKKGVSVQGVEEAGLRDLKDGLAVLRKGSQRRQVAETKLNTESSRSHSIFTLTVHVKETSIQKGGEDMLRIGKFNLVDLAGSEAISRSGAQGKHSREAGNINQSLLALGRVINALVDKTAQHIPYRDAKLTRLLQDSLGGRTKTCIIATVSPTKSNMEETLSTLDYASRAKSIRNKPEVNAHLTKAGLLREYLGDIERLKAELHATREKNGVYIPDDQWKEMTEERSQRKLEFDEARSRVAAVEIELRTRKSEFDQVTARFVSTSSELAEAREAERQLGVDLEAAKADVEAMRVALGDEMAISNAYAAGEERINAVAGELHSVAVDSVRDVGGLFDKLGRVTGVLGTNTESTHQFGAEMTTLSQDLQQRVSKLHTVQSDFGNTLRSDLEAYAKRGESESRNHMAELDKSLGVLNDLASRLAGSIEEGKSQTADASKAILAIKDEVQSSVVAWATAMEARSTKMVDELVRHQQSHLATVGTVLDTTTTLVDNVITAAREHVAAQAASITKARLLASRAAVDEMKRLQSQNALLTQLLAEEQSKNKRLSSDLVSNIANMVERFTKTQEMSLASAIMDVKDSNDRGSNDMEKFAEAYSDVAEGMSSSAQSFGDELDKAIRKNDKQRERGPPALAEVTTGLRTRLEEYGAETTSQVGERVDAVNALCAQIGTSVSESSSAAASRAQNHLNILAQVTASARAGNDLSAAYTRSSADEVARLTSTLLESHAASSSSSGKAHASAKRKLDAMLSTTSAFISGLAVDEPTGETPRKRVYEFPRSWERTAPRDMLLERIRRGSPLTMAPMAPMASSTASSSSLGSAPAPEPDMSIASASTTPFGEIVSISIPETASPEPELSRVTSVGSVGGLRSVSSAASLPGLAAPSTDNTERSATLDLPPSSALNISTRRRTKKLGSGEYDRDRPSLTVLGEGGNIPRRRRAA